MTRNSKTKTSRNPKPTFHIHHPPIIRIQPFKRCTLFVSTVTWNRDFEKNNFSEDDSHYAQEFSLCSSTHVNNFLLHCSCLSTLVYALRFIWVEGMWIIYMILSFTIIDRVGVDVLLLLFFVK